MADDQADVVLAYQAPQRTPARWGWFVGGVAAGIVATACAMFFVIRLGRSVTSTTTPAFVGTASSAAPTPTSPPVASPSFAFPQGEGKLHLTYNSMGVPYGKYLLLARGQDVVALRITCPSGIGRAISYEWLHSVNGGRDFGGPGVSRGSGSTVEKGGSGDIKAGPFSLWWSEGSDKGGWVYWPHTKGFAAAKNMADGVDQFAATLKTTGWRDEEGDTVDPRTQDVQKP